MLAAYSGVMDDRLYAISTLAAAPEFSWSGKQVGTPQECVVQCLRQKSAEHTQITGMEAGFKGALNLFYPAAAFAFEIKTPQGEASGFEGQNFRVRIGPPPCCASFKVSLLPVVVYAHHSSNPVAYAAVHSNSVVSTVADMNVISCSIRISLVLIQISH
jgi:hypothetical protein